MLDLTSTIQKIFAPGKGILANDESSKTIAKRFSDIGVSSDFEMNRKYRQMLLTTAGIEDYISGVIFYDETVRQKMDNGLSFADYVTQKDIIPGIKMDGGLEEFTGTEEKITPMPTDLEKRLIEYSQMGLKFTKWRGVFQITDIYPSEGLIEENLKRMSQFAKISQQSGFVPIVEPEILMDGNHTTARCEEITTKVLKRLFEILTNDGVVLEELVLKTSMVLPGKDGIVRAQPLEVAHSTLRTLKNSVPAEVPGIVFLSGGQNPDEATQNLNEIVKIATDVPWQISFSYLRALQEEARNFWHGDENNNTGAQELFLKRLKLVSQAREGKL